MKKTFLRMISLFGVLLAMGLIATQRAAADSDDPPGRVARLSYTHGEVSFGPAGEDEWVSAVVNRPITTGDKLWTDRNARAELHIGSAAIRLKGETGFSFLNLTDNMAQIRLTEGTIGIHLRHLDQDETFEVDTPNLAFNLLRPGDYRLQVNEDGNATIVSIRGGEGEVTGGGQAFTIHANESATFIGTEQLTSDFESLPDYDDFDNWCRDRQRREERSESARYVSRDVVGYEDLDEYGYWRPAAEYGTVWYPRSVAVGWAPYRYGHWVWISPWGWTWVDDEPWGFAPFHYGRWVFVGGAWGWCPGPIQPVGVAYVRPVYAPALVAWVGGRNWGVGIAVGGGPGVAWVPLAPREVYVPSYHVSQTYVTNVNVTNTTVNNTTVTNVYNTTIVNNNIHNNIHNDIHNNVHINNVRYANMNAPGAVTATSQAAFASAQPVSSNMVKVDAKAIASAQVSQGAAPTVAPARQSVLGAGASATVRPPAVVEARAVVAKTAPPPAPPSFAKQQEVIRQNGGRPPEVSQLRQMAPERAQAAPVKIAPPAQPAPPQNAMGNRPGQPPKSDRPDQRETPNRPSQPAVNQPGKPPSEAPPTPSRPNRSDRPASAQPETPNHASQPAVNQPGKPPSEAPPIPSRPNRDDQPPSAQPVNRPQPPENARSNDSNRPNNSDRPGNNRNTDVNPNRPANNDRQMQLEQKQQQEQQRLQQQQQQERQQLEQKHQQQLQRTQQQTENARQQQEHQQLQQRHDQQRQQMEQKHQQEQQKVQKQEVKQQEKDQKRPDKPPGH